MAKVSIEQLGGPAAFGSSAKVSFSGETTLEALPASARQWVEYILASPKEPFTPGPDGLAYRIVIEDANGSRSAVVSPEGVPEPLKETIEPIWK